LDELTGRQREALEAAYRAGYYAWPRESTAEAVAATLDIAPSTLHAHLRKAQETILAALFDP
jgi:predicted DNA binding protein